MFKYIFSLAILLVASVPCYGGDLFLVTPGAEVNKNEGGRRDVKREINGVQSAFVRSKGGVFEFVWIIHMLEEKADRKTIIQWLDWLANTKGIRDQDVLLFYLSFHGGPAGKLGVSLWVHDGGKEEGGSLLGEEIRKRLVRMKGQKILLIDSCYSGAAIRKAGKRFDWKDVTVVTTAGPNQVGWTDAMYRAICETLYGNADSNGDGLLQLGEFVDYLPPRITGLTKRWKLKPISHPLVHKAKNFNGDLVIGKIIQYPAVVNREGRDWPVTMLNVEGGRVQVRYLDGDQTAWLPYEKIRISDP